MCRSGAGGGVEIETERTESPASTDLSNSFHRPADSPLVGPNSDRSPTITVVMPTLDEEDGVQQCITDVERALCELDVSGEVIVSDSSSDRTPELAREAGAIVVEPDDDGYGYAYRYGFRYARGEYVVMGDADTTYDFSRLPDLLDPLVDGDADLVLGSRFRGEIKPGAMPSLHRYVGNPLLTTFLNAFYDADVTDAHSGFRAFDRDLLAALDLHASGMEFASEMVMDAAAKGLHIEEVPIVYHPREGDETLDSFQDGWRHVKFMLTNAPGYIFTSPSIGFVLAGVAIMATSLVGAQIAGLVFGTYTMVIGSLLTIVGYQVGSLAVFSSVAANPIREPADPVTEWICGNVSLEHGASVGLVLFTVGGVAATYMAVEWVTSGYAVRAPLNWLLLAFTTILLGVETVFYSFFLSLLAQSADKDEKGSLAVDQSGIGYSDTLETEKTSAEETQHRETGWNDEHDGPASTG